MQNQNFELEDSFKQPHTEVCNATLGGCESAQEYAQEKPFLPLPSSPMNPFSPTLCIYQAYLKILEFCIKEEGVSSQLHQEGIKQADSEIQALTKEESLKRREAAEKEKSANRWGVAAKIGGWFASVFAIVMGTALIISGVGAVAGSLLLAGGIIGLGSEIMEISGGWKKVTEILPGEDDAKKAVVCTWIQIGVAVVSLSVSLLAIPFGGAGFSMLGKSMQVLMKAFGGLCQGASGIATIGNSVETSQFKNKMADAKDFEIKLVQEKAYRETILQFLQMAPDRFLQFYQSTARTFNMLNELHRAEQSIIRR